ncbi:MAG: protein-L-isoaspartate(D-aspartate) O-methyltransferase [Chloroflexi bacterium]|nr:protein-L-isoaspartate(D-aspartate) O-methyltransferase [Chloroflexota bacterium]MBT7081554.1 protein-L-isoaspartate(D-aspartate) O-methyltransferase [Chloroflexota bacterium]MBT7289024.1 protein-L-isoaspartate(D-aspartate) O-methyltransferase [Chloroflexota bacterium]
MDYDDARIRLIDKLKREITDARVLDAMARVPRHLFVPEAELSRAYMDIPLPIGQDQTISQPYIVALMTQALELKGTETVLEVGSGCGYQAAILAELAEKVITVERLPSLSEKACAVLNDLGYTNIERHIASEELGWPSDAPYDAIIVTAGAPCVPQELIDQLGDYGRIVIPVGTRYEQELLKLTKTKDGTTTKGMGGCRFVPLIGPNAWDG